MQAAVVAAHGLRSCDTWAWLLCRMWNPPGPGIKPMSATLADAFPSLCQVPMWIIMHKFCICLLKVNTSLVNYCRERFYSGWLRIYRYNNIKAFLFLFIAPLISRTVLL